MKLKFIKVSETERNAKVTVHTSGKLGFSSDAITMLGITDQKSIAFAEDEESPEDKNLYAVIYDGIQEGTFKISKAGKYYYVNTKAMFDSLGLDYKNTKVIYDLVKFQHEGAEMIKMLRREVKKKKKEMPT